MRVEILVVDRLRTPWAREAVDTYIERIGHYAPIEYRHVKASKRPDPLGKHEEGKALLRAAAIDPRDRLVALSPGGRQKSSEAWARLLDVHRSNGVVRLVFVVGGADGLDDAVLSAADEIVSLGSQTLPHELAQVVLVEQIYRAWSILRNEPYHR